MSFSPTGCRTWGRSFRARRGVLGLPLLTWTVRAPEDRERAARFADQIIFEGFGLTGLRP